MDQQLPEGERITNGLPIISEEVKQKIVKDIDEANEGRGYADFGGIDDLLLATLTDAAEIKPELITALKEAVMAGGPSEANSLREYANGMAIVLRAFHTQSDYKLIPDLQKLGSEDISQIGELIKNRVVAFGGGKNPFDAALTTPRIPAGQSYLREIVDEPLKTNSSAYGYRYKAAAGIMYHAMEAIWHKLYPGNSNITPPPSIQS